MPFDGLNVRCGWADAIGVPEADPREAARRPTAFEAALPGGKRSVESGLRRQPRRGSDAGIPIASAAHQCTWQLKHECRETQRIPAALLCGSCAALTCHARRHWNSTSYRTAAGSYSPVLPIPQPALHGESLTDGAEGDRTPDLCSAIAALSQLSYSPAPRCATGMTRPGNGPLHPSHTGFQRQSPAESRRAPIQINLPQYTAKSRQIALRPRISDAVTSCLDSR